MFRFDRPTCPACRERPAGTVETVPGLALLCEVGGGLFDYEGTTELDWNAQRAVVHRRHRNRLLLECPHGHRWWSQRVEERR